MPNPNLPIGGQYNVYTGARYVPLIMGAWSETVAYEPLSVVTYQGNSYTSRTFVPAGVAPTNETYWAATGNYNAQVEQYRQEVQNLSDIVDTNTDDISIAQQKINALEAHNNTINNQYVLIGDSYLTVAGNWGTPFKENPLIDENNVVISGEGGSGFCSVGGAGNKFYNLLNALNSNTAVTHVVVCGGANDRSFSYSDITSAIREFCALSRTKFPNARIYCGVCGNNSKDATYRNSMINIAFAYSKITDYGGVYMPGLQGCLVSDSDFSTVPSENFAHPSPKGGAAIAGEIINYIFCGCGRVYNADPVTITNLNNITTTVNLVKTVNNGITTLNSKINVTFANPFTPPSSLDFPICLGVSGGIYGSTQRIPIVASVNNGLGSVGQIRVSDGRLNVTLFNNPYETFSSLSITIDTSLNSYVF